MTDSTQPASPNPDPTQPDAALQPPAPTTPPPPAWRQAAPELAPAATPISAPIATPPADSAAVTQPVAWTPSMAASEEGPAFAAAPPPAYAQPTPAPAPAPAPAAPSRRGGVGVATLMTAVLATAVLTSGGTYLAVSAANRDANDAQTAPAAQVATPPAGGQAPATAAPAPATPAPQTGEKSVVEIVKAVSPAVVTITAEGVAATNALGQTGTGTATGSGVIFDSNGLILTNRHVVSGNPSKLTVSLKDGRTLDASIYGIDTLTDLAIVKVNETGLPAAPIGDSSTIQVGQAAIAIGSPLGEFTDSVTSGIVSAIGRSIATEDGSTLSNLIQTDTAINPGNSGGPLLDPAGNVIGINTAIAGNAEGIGFAIPINMSKPLLAQASAGQQLARAWLGVRFVTIDATVKSENNLAADNGAWIPTTTGLASNQGGGVQPAPSQDPSQGQDPGQNFGLTPDQLDQLFRQFGINPNDLGQDPFGQGGTGQGQGGQGALSVEPIVAGSPAEAAGLAPGDIITAVDGTQLTQSNPLDLVVSQLSPGRTVTLDVLRNGQTITLSLTLGTRPTSV